MSYDRSVLQQTGSGHFSPVGAYDPVSDKLLILDVARFKYPPHWIHLTLAYDAMTRCDPTTGLPRGYLTLRHIGRGGLCLFRMTTSALSVTSTHALRVFQRRVRRLQDAWPGISGGNCGKAAVPGSSSGGMGGANSSTPSSLPPPVPGTVSGVCGVTSRVSVSRVMRVLDPEDKIVGTWLEKLCSSQVSAGIPHVPRTPYPIPHTLIPIYSIPHPIPHRHPDA